MCTDINDDTPNDVLERACALTRLFTRLAGWMLFDLSYHSVTCNCVCAILLGARYANALSCLERDEDLSNVPETYVL